MTGVQTCALPILHLAKLNAGAEKVLFIANNQNELVIEALLNEKNEISIL